MPSLTKGHPWRYHVAYFKDKVRRDSFKNKYSRQVIAIPLTGTATSSSHKTHDTPFFLYTTKVGHAFIPSPIVTERKIMVIHDIPACHSGIVYFENENSRDQAMQKQVALGFLIFCFGKERENKNIIGHVPQSFFVFCETRSRKDEEGVLKDAFEAFTGYVKFYTLTP